MPLVGYKGAHAHTGIPLGTLRAKVSKKEIPHVRTGPRSVLFDLAQLDRWIEDHTVKPQADAAPKMGGDVQSASGSVRR